MLGSWGYTDVAILEAGGLVLRGMMDVVPG